MRKSKLLTKQMRNRKHTHRTSVNDRMAETNNDEGAEQISTVLHKMETLLQAGNFREAIRINDRASEDGSLSVDEIAALPMNVRIRAKAAALSARLLFYRGDNFAACRQLDEYAKNMTDQFLDMDSLLISQKLVLAEYYYSKGDFDTAIAIAWRILRDCNDPWGQGDLHHFLARCQSKRHEYDKLAKSCDDARQSFLQCIGGPKDTNSIHWKIGLVYLLEGFSLWRKGDTEGGCKKLYTAQAMLKNTGDYINIANVEHSLGCILHSQGRHDEAFIIYSEALNLYAESRHMLNKSRVLTHIGKVKLQTRLFKEAGEALDQALKLSRQYGHRRQEAEILVTLSWLELDKGNLPIADKMARDALKLAVSPDISSPELEGQARISLGYYRYRRGEFDTAINDFKLALQNAQTHKLRINAHLSLAEAYLAKDNLHLALHHFERAKKMFVADSSYYLWVKIQSIQQKLAASSGEYFMKTFEEIEKVGLNEILKDLNKWSIRKALEKGGNVAAAARILKIGRQNLVQKMKRLQLRVIKPIDFQERGSDESGQISHHLTVAD